MDAAKQYRTDEELIRAVNQLEEGTVPDKMLLIPAFGKFSLTFRRRLGRIDPASTLDSRGGRAKARP